MLTPRSAVRTKPVRAITSDEVAAIREAAKADPKNPELRGMIPDDVLLPSPIKPGQQIANPLNQTARPLAKMPAEKPIKPMTAIVADGFRKYAGAAVAAITPAPKPITLTGMQQRLRWAVQNGVFDRYSITTNTTGESIKCSRQADAVIAHGDEYLEAVQAEQKLKLSQQYVGSLAIPEATRKSWAENALADRREARRD